jgi:serine/threonine-protein kinase
LRLVRAGKGYRCRVRSDAPADPGVARARHGLVFRIYGLHEGRAKNSFESGVSLTRPDFIHRDIKPANVLFCERGCVPDFVKVVDFGLVKVALQENGNLSTANMIAGTPAYMAPEMITTPEKIDGRADLYALGGVGYYLLTGRAVFEGCNMVELCSHHLHTAPVPPSTLTDVPSELESLLLACLAKDPDDRPADASALVKRLEACVAESPWSADEARLFWAARRESEGHTSVATRASVAAIDIAS